MHVLDIDLDFFLDGRVTGRADDPNSRPDDWEITPWTGEAAVAFIQGALNLQHKTPGAIVQSHHEVFYHWRRLIGRGELQVPFSVCHVDAHADLGCAMPVWEYLNGDFLKLPVRDRAYPREGIQAMNYGSYMAFAIGNRWFTEVDFVVPECWRDDIPLNLLRESDLEPNGSLFRPNRSLQIELRYISPDEVESLRCGGRPLYTIGQSVGEPRIPLHIIAHDSLGDRYKGVTWDYVFLSHSPGYTPTSADALLPVNRAIHRWGVRRSSGPGRGLNVHAKELPQAPSRDAACACHRPPAPGFGWLAARRVRCMGLSLTAQK